MCGEKEVVHVPYRSWTEEHTSLWCDDCGMGYAMKNNYGVKEGDNCDNCGQPLYVKVWKSFHRVPAHSIVTCYCGHEVYADQFTNECDNCGRLYNSNGDDLLPRHMWEEDLGNDDPYLDAEGFPLV